MSTELNLREPLTGPAQRDAIHVAVYPMTAIREMKPGEQLTNGIVNPFLTAPVQPGEKFYLFLWPGSVTSLRHCWTHPMFPEESQLSEKSRSEADVWEQLNREASIEAAQ